MWPPVQLAQSCMLAVPGLYMNKCHRLRFQQATHHGLRTTLFLGWRTTSLVQVREGAQSEYRVKLTICTLFLHDTLYTCLDIPSRQYVTSTPRSQRRVAHGNSSENAVLMRAHLDAGSVVYPNHNTEPQTPRRFVPSFQPVGAALAASSSSTQRFSSGQTAYSQSQATVMQMPPPGARISSIARSGAQLPQGAMSMPPTPSMAQQRIKRFVPSTPSMSGGRSSSQRMAFTPLDQNQNG